MKPRRIRTGREGMTLVELSVAMLILTLIIALPGMIFSTSSRAYSTGSLVGATDAATRRALDTITERLRSSSFAQIQESAAGIQTSSITFRASAGFVGTAIVWGNLERFELRPDPRDPLDGIDNDGDGLVDERQLVWIQNLGLANERVQVLCSNVRAMPEGEIPANGMDDNGDGFVDEEGLAFAYQNGQVRMQLVIQRSDSFGVVSQSAVQRQVGPRN